MPPRCRSLVYSLVVLLLASVGCTPDKPNRTSETPEPSELGSAPQIKVLQEVPHGRLEDLGGLRLLRLWGTSSQRGTAHAQLLGQDIVDTLRAELNFNFGSHPAMLTTLRLALPVLVRLPASVQDELTAMMAALRTADLDLQMPGFERELDLFDLRLVTALDVIATMGCSGFTLWGDKVQGGGVLTARNFDWTNSGPHMLNQALLLVQHPEHGHATACVSWPGYLGAITAINQQGLAVFLHMANGGQGRQKNGALPTAVAARLLLEEAEPGSTFQQAKALLEQTSPPKGYLTRVVLPQVPADQSAPVRVFEASTQKVEERVEHEHCVVTNHFRSQAMLNGAEPATGSRYQQLAEHLANAPLGPQEAWQALRQVQAGGNAFATLHSLVFRAEPWVFELAIGQFEEDGEVLPAPQSPRRYVLAREQVFPDDFPEPGAEPR